MYHHFTCFSGKSASGFVMSLSEQNEDLTIALICLSILIWLSKIAPSFVTEFDAEMNSSPILRGWMIGGGLCIEHRLDITVLHIKLAISHGLYILDERFHVVICSIWHFTALITHMYSGPNMMPYIVAIIWCYV